MHTNQLMHILNALLGMFYPRANWLDSWGANSFNSIKTGSWVTPDPIRLLAPVHDHDVNDNATEDNHRDGRKHDKLEAGRQDCDADSYH